MSRDFSPDLDSFREVARETREKPPESSRTERGRASRQKEEDRDLSRLPEVQAARPREVPAKEARTVLSRLPVAGIGSANAHGSRQVPRYRRRGSRPLCLQR